MTFVGSERRTHEREPSRNLSGLHDPSITGVFVKSRLGVNLNHDFVAEGVGTTPWEPLHVVPVRGERVSLSDEITLCGRTDQREGRDRMKGEVVTTKDPNGGLVTIRKVGE